MLLGVTYQLVLFIADLVPVRTRSDAQLRAEVLALRHQLRLLERKVGKPAWQPGDRILLAGLSRPSQAPATRPHGVIGLVGWANRLFVLLYCAWAVVVAATTLRCSANRAGR